MKKQFKILLLLLLTGISLILVGCGKPVELEAPVIKLDETVLSWNLVPNATKYKVSINDESYETTASSYDLKGLDAVSYSIKVTAIGDGKKFANSKSSNIIDIVGGTNNVILEKISSDASTLKYKVRVLSPAYVLGFIIDVKYDPAKLAITENKISWTNLLPNSWIYDINIKDGHVIIAVTGLEPINVKLIQTLINLEFSVTTTADATIDSFIVDNG